MNRASRGLDKAEEVSCIPMAEHRPISDGQYRGHVSAMSRKQRVPDGVDGRMSPMQSLRPEAMADRLFTYSGRDQLRSRDDAVLPGREFSDQLVGGYV